MSMRVRAFCEQSVAAVTAEMLHGGIAARFGLLASLLGTETEEEPEDVLGRLEVEESGDAFDVILLHTGRGQPPIRVERWEGDQADTDVKALLEALEARPSPTAEKIGDMLVRAAEVVAFHLEPRHAHGSGWPLAVAGAVWLAEVGGGLVYADGTGWLAPKGHDVMFLLDAKR
jgi:hypothetical protein